MQNICVLGFATRHNIPVYSYEDLEQHTDMFNAEPLDIGGRLLGSGGYGKVFMGRTMRCFTYDFIPICIDTPW